MAFIPCPNIAEFRLQYLWDLQQCENVFHVYKSAGWTADDLNTVGGTFANWWTSELFAEVSNTVTLQRIMTRDLTTESGVGTEVLLGLPANGQRTSAALPNSVSLAVKWGTGLAGRSYRGRTFHIGLCDDQVTGNTVLAATQTSLKTKYDFIRIALDNALLGVEFGVLSRYHNGAPRAAGILTPITGVGIDPVTDTQRRRSPGRGR